MIKLPFSDGSGDYLVNPSKIIALGLNYQAHIEESVSVNVKGFDKVAPKEPVLFPKAPSSLIGPGEDIIIPAALSDYDFPTPSRTDHEAELAFIIKDECKDVPAEEAYSHILGYTCFNDVSQRNLQTGDKAGWFRGKSLDTFGPIGPVIVKTEDLEDPQNLNICCRLNGKLVQESNTSFMIFRIPEIVAFISRWFTLKPGDIIITGTPSGISPLKGGDVVEVEIEKIGILKNRVIAG
ncbi:MAG: fumarylacetoacetate hydrolase family protein [Spirochaetales bacterium]|nr:fumarylacetoacetate hydrolase family protein [Spirochaetales bacterium]